MTTFASISRLLPWLLPATWGEKLGRNLSPFGHCALSGAFGQHTASNDHYWAGVLHRLLAAWGCVTTRASLMSDSATWRTKASLSFPRAQSAAALPLALGQLCARKHSRWRKQCFDQVTDPSVKEWWGTRDQRELWCQCSARQLGFCILEFGLCKGQNAGQSCRPAMLLGPLSFHPWHECLTCIRLSYRPHSENLVNNICNSR